MGDQMSTKALARAIFLHLQQTEGMHISVPGYVGPIEAMLRDDLRDVVIDGSFDMIDLAEFVAGWVTRRMTLTTPVAAEKAPDLDEVSLLAVTAIFGEMLRRNVRLAYGANPSLPDALTQEKVSQMRAEWQLIIRDALKSATVAK